MSTVNNNKKQDKFAKIAKIGEIIFHTKDLANLWGITNKNTLHTTLKRYQQKGLLYRIYRGLYSIKPVKEIDPYLVGIKALHSYSYISTESVLAENGIIFQAGRQITIVSGQSAKFSINGQEYRSRKLADKFLYNQAGIYKSGGILKAEIDRAIADLLYFNSKAYFDAENEINWKRVKEIQKEIGYPLTPKRYDFTR